MRFSLQLLCSVSVYTYPVLLHLHLIADLCTKSWSSHHLGFRGLFHLRLRLGHAPFSCKNVRELGLQVLGFRLFGLPPMGSWDELALQG